MRDHVLKLRKLVDDYAKSHEAIVKSHADLRDACAELQKSKFCRGAQAAGALGMLMKGVSGHRALAEGAVKLSKYYQQVLPHLEALAGSVNANAATLAEPTDTDSPGEVIDAEKVAKAVVASTHSGIVNAAELFKNLALSTPPASGEMTAKGSLL